MSSSVPEGWSVYALGDICRVKGGKRLPKGSAFSETITPFPYIRVADFESGSIETRGIKYVSTNVREQIKRYTISSSDIYISIAGSIGLVGIVPRVFNGALLTENAAKIVLNDEYLDRTYLCLFLSSEIAQSQFKQEIGTGGGVPKLALFRIEQTILSVPPLPEQKKIASILTSVDEVIENTQKQIDKLQDLKKATMNELLTKGIGHTEFKDSELGRIPKSWECVKMARIAKVTDGAHKTPKYMDSGVPFLRVTDIHSTEIDIKKTKYISTKEHLELCKRCHPERGDILYSKNGTIGISKIIDWDWDFSIFVSLALLKLHDRDSLRIEFLDLYLQSPVVAKQIKDRSKQGTVNNLHLEEIRKFDVVMPSINEQLEITTIIQSIQGRISKVKDKLSQTQSLKKSLMQDLLTGKVRVTVN